jgi:hypothetical protein
MSHGKPPPLSTAAFLFVSFVFLVVKFFPP